MIQAILTDIEGTTSSLSFVQDVLFPYARERLPDFVREHAANPKVRAQLDAVQKVVPQPLNDGEIIQQLLRWIDEDRKITPLKALQGMIWEEGYRQGAFNGHVYEDAARNLRLWHAHGVRLYIFSSGSVQAQRLLFGFSDAGDLTPLFSDYFDTRIGSKREQAAYQAVAEQIGLPANAILFLSDIKEELDAARQAGMQTIWFVRDGVLTKAAEHPQVRNFDEIQL